MALKVNLRPLIEEKSKRENRVITQKEVAEAAGVNASMLSRYANGFTTSLNSDVLEKLLDYFECEIGELLIRDAS